MSEEIIGVQWTPKEAVVVLVLAMLGDCMMSGNVEGMKDLRQFLVSESGTSELAITALEKFRKSMEMTAEVISSNSQEVS